MSDSDNDDDWSVYFYNPSLPAAILFSALYIIPFLYHLSITITARRKAQYTRLSYSIPILIAAALEVIGYAQRAASTQSVQDIGLFATSQTLIVLAPVFVCASLYVLLSRLIRSSVPQGTDGKENAAVLGGTLKVKWLPAVFITLDILSCLTQGSGSGIAAAGDWEGEMKDIGTGVLIGGLALQLVTFSVFLVVVVTFHVRALRGLRVLEEGMGMVVRGVYVGGFFIMVRSIFRLIEFILGVDAYTFNNEWPLYVLEAVPMLFAFMVLGWYHPSRWLPVSFGASADESQDAGDGKRRWRRRRRSHHRRSHGHGHHELQSV